MSLINGILRPIFDGLLYPFRGLHPFWGVTLVSVAVAIFMLIVFKRTSDQAALEQVKRRIHACIFEIRLYNDDLRAILRAQFEILRHNWDYMKLSLWPMVWILPPLVLIIAQLQFHYGYVAPRPGDRMLVKAVLTEQATEALSGSRPKVVLEVDTDGVEVETPAVWIPSRRELVWRISVQAPGAHELRVRMGEQTAAKSLDARPDVVRRSPIRLSSGFLDQLLYPAEALLSAGPFESISVGFVDADVAIPGLGWGTHWLIVFFVLSIVFAFALRRPFGVTI